MLRATLTLLAGGALAQALPLLLGPLLTRLYSPQDYGAFHLFAAVATNLAVVACARYEFALPLAREEAEAAALWRLCARLLAGVSALTLLGGLGWAWWRQAAWALWLGPAVAVGGALSLVTMWATRAQRFQALAWARVLQYGGAALAQALAGWLHGGVAGLVVAPIAAQTLAALLLYSAADRLPPPSADPALHWRALAQRYREFPLLNTPHAFLGALQDTASLALIAATLGPAAAGFWGLALRYLKAPASLVGGAVSQVLYPHLTAQSGSDEQRSASTAPTAAARQAVRRIMALLGAAAVSLCAALMLAGPWLFAQLFGPDWRQAGELARTLAPYIGAHFVASPLAVVTMAWQAQAWALRLALWGQVAYLAALALGLHLGGLAGAGWGVSAAMLVYFGWYFYKLATWPVQ